MSIIGQKQMQLKDIVLKTGFRFKKNLGQNFIENESVLKRIVDCADITKDDTVLEIGVGGGTLTREIARRAKCVFGYEIDKSLQPVLAQSLAGVDNAEIIFKDFMRVPMSEVEKDLGKDYVVIANLPYYITSPIVMRLLEEGKNCKRIVVTVQKEVADRFCAKVGDKDYGAITLAIDALSDPLEAAFIGKENFYPVPKVDSAVARLDINKEKYGGLDYPSFRETVRIAFLSRRKTLANNLINTLKVPRDEAEKLLSEAGIDLAVRGERLAVEDFIRLAKALKERKLI